MGWWYPADGITNESLFSATSNGQRNYFDFEGVGLAGYWWSSTESPTTSTDAYYMTLKVESHSSFLLTNYKKAGRAVRCVKN